MRNEPELFCLVDLRGAIGGDRGVGNGGANMGGDGMRMVEVTIIYDTDKPLSQEMHDWLMGKIDFQDVLEANDGDVTCIRIKEKPNGNEHTP